MNRRLRTGLLTTLVIVIVVVWSIPFFSLLAASLKTPADFFQPAFFAPNPTWQNFGEVFSDPKTFVMLRNSLIIASLTTAVSVVFGTLCGYGLARLGVRPWVVGAAVFLLLFFRFYPRIAMVIPFFVMMRDAGLFDTPWAVVLGHLGITVPFVTWLMLIAFRGVPHEMDEAGALDGASVPQRFFHLVLPVVGSSIATAAVLTAVLSWNEFLIAQSLTRSSNPVLSTGVASFITDAGVQLGPMAALSVVICMPIVVFALLMQRHFVAGMTMGAVKG
ncbi:carbohydrate ABC transporter permease [Microbacterium luticocti]|uniref:carbohydrate ABC transporter permease n=1 Tax=Microbacterium luticocti TaxID=451764 RepID=UPI000417FC24|nr:carbohydrate ABC transporter permease [Microbacterium luticocti]